MSCFSSPFLLMQRASFSSKLLRKVCSQIDNVAGIHNNNSSTKSAGLSRSEARAKVKPMAAARLQEAEIERMARNFCKWLPTSNRPVQPQIRETVLSVMTYNILAQTNLDGHKSLYDFCQPEQLRWPYRCEKILKTIIRQNCDILCLQEVQQEHLQADLVPRLSARGYQYVFKAKTGDKDEGCAIFWNRDKFNILQWSPVEMFLPGCRVLNRHNVGLVAVLSPRTNPKAKICVATTHLLFNPRRGEVKLAQLRYLMATVEAFAFLGTSMVNGSPMHMPTILCGDLNATPHTPIYKFITEGKLELAGRYCAEITTGGRSGPLIRKQHIHVGELLPCSILENDYVDRYGVEALNSMDHAYENDFVYHLMGQFQSCYTHTKKGQPEVSSYADDPVNVDYIFFKRSRLIRHLATLSLMTENELDQVGRIPNSAMGSDHLPLAASFLLKEIPDNYLQSARS